MAAPVEPSSRSRTAPDHAWRRVALTSSAAAAGVHFGAVHGHARVWPAAAGFMLICGVAQLGWALWVARGAPRWAVRAGAAGNAAVVMLFVVSRTAGLPVGPTPWMPEHLHGPDVLATVLEVITILAARALVTGVNEPPAPFLNRLALAGALAAALVAGHDPGHETGAAAAVLLVAIVGSRVPFPVFDRRSHVETAFDLRPAPGIHAHARPGLGTSG